MKSGLANLHQFDVSTYGHAAQSGRGRGGALVGVSGIAVATQRVGSSGGEWRELSVLIADGGDLVPGVRSRSRRKHTWSPVDTLAEGSSRICQVQERCPCSLMRAGKLHPNTYKTRNSTTSKDSFHD